MRRVPSDESPLIMNRVTTERTVRLPLQPLRQATSSDSRGRQTAKCSSRSLRGRDSRTDEDSESSRGRQTVKCSSHSLRDRDSRTDEEAQDDEEVSIEPALDAAASLIPSPQLAHIPDDIPSHHLAALITRVHVKTALQFLSQREPRSTRKFLQVLIKQFHSTANPLIGNANALYKVGKTSFGNMRYTFKKTIVKLARAYISNNERERGPNGLPIPTALILRSMIDWEIVETAFNKSLQNLESTFLDSTPAGSYRRVRTVLKNVIVSGVIIFFKHFERIDFVGDKEVDIQLYRLDALTPSPAFVGPEKIEHHIPGSKRRKLEESLKPLQLQLFDSDGETEDVEL